MNKNKIITSIWIYLCIVMLVTMLQGCTFVGKVVTGIKYIFYFFSGMYRIWHCLLDYTFYQQMATKKTENVF